MVLTSRVAVSLDGVMHKPVEVQRLTDIETADLFSKVCQRSRNLKSIIRLADFHLSPSSQSVHHVISITTRCTASATVRYGLVTPSRFVRGTRLAWTLPSLTAPAYTHTCQAFSQNRIILTLYGHPGAAIETAALLSANPTSKVRRVQEVQCCGCIFVYTDIQRRGTRMFLLYRHIPATES